MVDRALGNFVYEQFVHEQYRNIASYRVINHTPKRAHVYFGPGIGVRHINRLELEEFGVTAFLVGAGYESYRVRVAASEANAWDVARLEHEADVIRRRQGRACSRCGTRGNYRVAPGLCRGCIRRDEARVHRANLSSLSNNILDFLSPPTADEVRALKRAAAALHPDVGGTAEAFDAAMQTYRTAQRRIMTKG